MTCVFCAIVREEAPAVFRAKGISSVAIEPLGPVVPGHLLVIPRTHVRDALEDPGVTATSMFDASAWAELFGYESVNLITSVGAPATQTVKHLHIHIVPRAPGDGLALPWTKPKGEGESP